MYTNILNFNKYYWYIIDMKKDNFINLDDVFIVNLIGGDKKQKEFAIPHKNFHRLVVSRDNDFVFYSKKYSNDVIRGSMDAIEVSKIVENDFVIGYQRMDQIKKGSLLRYEDSVGVAFSYDDQYYYIIDGNNNVLSFPKLESEKIYNSNYLDNVTYIVLGLEDERYGHQVKNLSNTAKEWEIDDSYFYIVEEANKLNIQKNKIDEIYVEGDKIVITMGYDIDTIKIKE